MYFFEDSLWGSWGGVAPEDAAETEDNGQTGDDSDTNGDDEDRKKAGELKPVDRDGMYDEPQYVELDEDVNYLARLNTSYGPIIIELYEDETPKTVRNFIFLARDGFYNDLIFHRVIKDFIIQTGDPLGQGFGGPGYTFEDEIVEDRKFGPYAVAMANPGPDSNGSQFFITAEDADAEHLNGVHTIFGRVIRGYSVVDQIEDVDTDQQYKPWSEIKIESVEIIERGFFEDLVAGYWWLLAGILVFAVGVLVFVVIKNNK
ncbi:peptidylprolyl isomerase [Candidatus Dojkabacteria bacterium]|nr:peptidylprolyl isomerase [Candidatus Dojkabacteria bacterium]